MFVKICCSEGCVAWRRKGRRGKTPSTPFSMSLKLSSDSFQTSLPCLYLPGQLIKRKKFCGEWDQYPPSLHFSFISLKSVACALPFTMTIFWKEEEPPCAVLYIVFHTRGGSSFRCNLMYVPVYGRAWPSHCLLSAVMQRLGSTNPVIDPTLRALVPLRTCLCLIILM